MGRCSNTEMDEPALEEAAFAGLVADVVLAGVVD